MIGLRGPGMIGIDEIGNAANGPGFGPVGLFRHNGPFLEFRQRTCRVHDPHFCDFFDKGVADVARGSEPIGRRVHVILGLAIKCRIFHITSQKQEQLLFDGVGVDRNLLLLFNIGRQFAGNLS